MTSGDIFTHEKYGFEYTKVITNHAVCKTCSSWISLWVMPETHLHWGRLQCPKCGFVGWEKNPDSHRNTGTRLQRHGNRLTVDKIQAFHGYKQPFCFMCLRKSNELGVRESLTADHIKELRMSEEGEDLDNVTNGQILCTACHKMKLWLTTYVTDHIQSKFREKSDDRNSETIKE